MTLKGWEVVRTFRSYRSSFALESESQNGPRELDILSASRKNSYLKFSFQRSNADSKMYTGRIPGTDDEDAVWTSMNSRFELPAMVDGRRRSHHRSRTSGSLTTVSLPLKSPVRSRARTPSSVRVGGISPEEYFAVREPSKSTTALDVANIGKALLHHRPLGSSSGSSQGSTGT